MFGVEFLKNGTEIKKSPRWRKLYCNKLQNDTPYDPVEVLSKAVGGGANRFLRFLQSSRCITRGSVGLVGVEWRRIRKFPYVKA